MHTFVPYDDDTDAKDQATRLHHELDAKGLANQLQPWGKIWVRAGKVICTMPSHPTDEFSAPAILFIDESLDIKRNIFYIGALAFSAPSIIIATARYLQNLVVLSQAHKDFWLHHAAPPRLHVRELNNPSDRVKTKWKQIPRHDIEMLLKTIVPPIKEQAGLKFIAPIALDSLKRSLSSSFSDQRGSQQEQLAIQLSSLMLSAMLSNTSFTIEKLEVIADYNPTRIIVGSKKRQATLHFFEGLHIANALKTQSENLPIKCDLIIDKDARYSSKFPSDFSLNALENQGYCIRKLVESVGLQLIDVYLGIGRIIDSEKKPYMGITSDDLGTQTVARVNWLQN